MMSVVEGRSVDEEEGKDSFEGGIDDAAVEIEIETTPQSEIRKISGTVNSQLRKAEHDNGLPVAYPNAG